MENIEKKKGRNKQIPTKYDLTANLQVFFSVTCDLSRDLYLSPPPVKTLNLEISPCRLADYVEELN